MRLKPTLQIVLYLCILQKAVQGLNPISISYIILYNNWKPKNGDGSSLMIIG
jgi:hypothetical protein